MFDAIARRWRARRDAAAPSRPANPAGAALSLPWGWNAESLANIAVSLDVTRQNLLHVTLKGEPNASYYGVRPAREVSLHPGKTACFSLTFGPPEGGAIQAHLVLRAFDNCGTFLRQEQKPLVAIQRPSYFDMALEDQERAVTVQPALLFERKIHGSAEAKFLIGDVSLRVL